MLPFDHRASFVHGLFGWTGALSRQQIEQIAAAKQVVYAALLTAIDAGVPWDRAALLVDEELGRDILVDARAKGLTTACPIEAMDPTYCKVLVRGRTPLEHPELYQYDFVLPDIAEVWRRGSAIASWLLDLVAIGERFASRGEAEFANRLLSALRFEFGGHQENRP